jgi:hypothetical protein
MRGYDASYLAALEAKGLIYRELLLFEFPEGAYGFWTGAGIRTWNAIDFVAAASFFRIDFGEENTALESRKATIELRGNPDAGLTPDVLGSIHSYTWSQAPVTLYSELYSLTTRASVSQPQVEWKGIIDTIDERETADGQFALVASCESRSIDYTRRGGNIRTSEHQQRISVGDKFFDYVSAAGSHIEYFGAKAPKKVEGRKNQGATV